MKHESPSCVRNSCSVKTTNWHKDGAQAVWKATSRTGKWGKYNKRSLWQTRQSHLVGHPQASPFAWQSSPLKSGCRTGSQPQLIRACKVQQLSKAKLFPSITFNPLTFPLHQTLLALSALFLIMAWTLLLTHGQRDPRGGEGSSSPPNKTSQDNPYRCFTERQTASKALSVVRGGFKTKELCPLWLLLP